MVDEGRVDSALYHRLLYLVHHLQLSLLRAVLYVLLIHAVTQLHLAVVDLPQRLGLDLLELLLVPIVGQHYRLSDGAVLFILGLLTLVQLVLEGLRLLIDLVLEPSLGLLQPLLEGPQLFPQHPHDVADLSHLAPEFIAAVFEVVVAWLGLSSG